MANKKYWQSFSEFNESEQHKKLTADEFREELPSVNPGAAMDLESSSPSRRDFLKYLGFSTAAAAIAASCETPVRKAIPFVNKPQDIVPGVSDYYATTYQSEGESTPILAKVRDGRPIKIEGNSLSTYSRSGTSAKVQASVLDLYDTSRQRFPTASGNAVSWDQLDKQIGTALAGSGSIVLLTGSVTSPTTKLIIKEFTAKYPSAKQVQYDAISYAGILLANEAAYGKRAIPTYKFENAKVIVSLGADFLGTWLDAAVYQRSYASRRKLSKNFSELSKHYHFESMMSMTGASADERFTHKPSETAAVAVALLAAVNGTGVTGIANPRLASALEKAAKDLKNANGSALVVSGSNNSNVQTVVNAINEAIGANGKTIDWSSTLQTKQGVDGDFASLIADMEAGRVNTIIINDVNPAYNYFDSKKFTDALKKVSNTIAVSYKQDETAELCKFIAPVHHFLESWGDAEPHTGYISLMQPTISPLFSTRQFQESLLKWSGATTSYETYFRNYWTTTSGGADGYDKALQEGVIEPANAGIGVATYNGGTVAAATSALSAAPKSGALELVLYENVALGDGRQANNPWLQELPDPITKAVWDNYLIVSPKFGREVLGVDLSRQRDADEYEVHPEKPVLSVKVGGKEILLPAVIIPGMNDDTVAIALGYGRRSASNNDEDTAKKIGRAVVGVGANAYVFTSYNGTTVDRFALSVTVSKTDGVYQVARNQTHNSYEGRQNVVQELTFDIQ
ncbi:MAG: TAT-variant-translocated molybdopterin oxidoreductase [Flavitalea sp.]